MSYPSFKHWLGETSLERKCRFIFGLGILVLVSGSFFWYGQKTDNLLHKQTTQTARMLVNPTLLTIHYKSLGNMNFAPALDVISGDLQSLDDLPNHEARILDPYNPTDPNKQPHDEFERQTIARFARAGATARRAGHLPGKAHTFADGSPTWTERITNGKKELQYIQAVFFKPNCLMSCHGRQDDQPGNPIQATTPDGPHRVRAKDGDLAGAVVINLPMEQTYKAINSNHAILITAAMTTAILAMVAFYTIIRYAIIKPLKWGLEV